MRGSNALRNGGTGLTLKRRVVVPSTASFDCAVLPRQTVVRLTADAVSAAAVALLAA